MTQENFPIRPYVLLTVALLLPWCLITLNMVGNADNLWLAEGFLRFVRGEGLAESFFEVNPPLSILLYALPATISAVFHLPLQLCIFIYTLSAVFLFAGALHWALKHMPALDRAGRIVVLAAFVLASTLTTTGYFGERDHFLVMALVPFLLIQLLTTMDVAYDRKSAGLIAFFTAIFILLKPHFLLLPTVMFAYRAVKRRQLFSVVRDVDCLALLAAGVGYGILLFALFPDYMTRILPVVVDYYGLLREDDVIRSMLIQYVASAALLMVFAKVVIKDAQMCKLALFLAAMSFLALVPFAVQGLGYAYHLIPATVLLWMGLGLLLYQVILKQDVGCAMTVALSIAVCAAGAYAMKPPQQSFISADAYAELPLVKAARDCGRPDCRVFVFSPSFEMSYLIVHYAEAQMASRFPSLFFLPGQLANSQIVEEEREGYRAMVAADFARYKPDIVMLAAFEIVRGQGDFNLPEYFGRNPAFKDEWKNYERAGDIEAPFDDYLKGSVANRDRILHFTIYKRKSSE